MNARQIFNLNLERGWYHASKSIEISGSSFKIMYLQKMENKGRTSWRKPKASNCPRFICRIFCSALVMSGFLNYFQSFRFVIRRGFHSFGRQWLSFSTETPPSIVFQWTFIDFDFPLTFCRVRWPDEGQMRLRPPTFRMIASCLIIAGKSIFQLKLPSAFGQTFAKCCISFHVEPWWILLFCDKCSKSIRRFSHIFK